MVAVAIFGGSLWLFQHLGAEFVPKLDEGSISAMLYKRVGMSLEESLRTDIEVENRLFKEFPEITRVFTRIGTSEIATDPMPPNESDVYIFYKPVADWPKTPERPANKAELREQIEPSLKQTSRTKAFRRVGKDFRPALSTDSGCASHYARVACALPVVYCAEFCNTLRSQHPD